MSTDERRQSLDAEVLAGHRFAYQEDISLVEDVDLLAATVNAIAVAACGSRERASATFQNACTHAAASASPSASSGTCG